VPPKFVESLIVVYCWTSPKLLVRAYIRVAEGHGFVRSTYGQIKDGRRRPNYCCVGGRARPTRDYPIRKTAAFRRPSMYVVRRIIVSL